MSDDRTISYATPARKKSLLVFIALGLVAAVMLLLVVMVLVFVFLHGEAPVSLTPGTPVRVMPAK